MAGGVVSVGWEQRGLAEHHQPETLPADPRKCCSLLQLSEKLMGQHRKHTDTFLETLLSAIQFCKSLKLHYFPLPSHMQTVQAGKTALSISETLLTPHPAD